MDLSSPNLGTLPPEIQTNICAHLKQRSLLSLTLTSPAVSGVAIAQLYHTPKFRSTYRLAQFVHTVSHSPRYADLVRTFNLWDNNEDDNITNDFASWMEWKYRSVPLYAARPAPRDIPEPHPKRISDPPRKRYEGTHPACNRRLCKPQYLKSVPLGATLHILTACKNLRSTPINNYRSMDVLTLSRSVNIYFKVIAQDYIVKSETYPPTTFTSQIFGSDVPRSWLGSNTEVEPVTIDAIIQLLVQLPHLENLRIRKAYWLSWNNIKAVFLGCSHLKYLDFTESGQVRQPKLGSYNFTTSEKRPWSVKGNKQMVAEILEPILMAESMQSEEP